MSAYACEPGRGSEPGVGWQFAMAAASRHEVTVLTRKNNVDAVQQAISGSSGGSLKVVGVDLSEAMMRAKRGQRGIHIYYPFWQRAVAKEARRLHNSQPFDVVHHVTLAVDWMPAGAVVARLAPSVWGPVGGAQPMPWRAARWLGVRGAAAEIVRSTAGATGRSLAGRQAARSASLIVATNREVAARFERRGTSVVVEPNVAIDVEPGSMHLDVQSAGSRLRRAVFAGRLLPWKGAALAVATLAERGGSSWRLEVFGSGPDGGRLRTLANRLAVADRVDFRGSRPRDEVLKAVASADAFLYPSFREASGWAVGEAVHFGTPVVCLNSGGPAVLVSEEAGILVEPRGAIPAALADALGRLPARPATPSRRWASDRLPDLLDGWYMRARASDHLQ